MNSTSTDPYHSITSHFILNRASICHYYFPKFPPYFPHKPTTIWLSDAKLNSFCLYLYYVLCWRHDFLGCSGMLQYDHTIRAHFLAMWTNTTIIAASVRCFCLHCRLLCGRNDLLSLAGHLSSFIIKITNLIYSSFYYNFNTNYTLVNFMIVIMIIRSKGK